jgi:hypothetical protein
MGTRIAAPSGTPAASRLLATLLDVSDSCAYRNGNTNGWGIVFAQGTRAAEGD